MKRFILFLSIILLIAPVSEAKQGHMKLLAVKETEDGYEGAIADLYLEIKQGSGRVFLDTFPLTKLDTQISTRFGKDIACSYLDIDCSKYDFIYTIRADSPIIAGPSAGGAITLLTISLLEGFELDESIGITGTINSGGIIGSVGGVKEKIDAASKNGIKKVLIPEGERFVKEDRKVIETITITRGNKTVMENASITDKTTDLVEYGKKRGLEIVEVSDIDEALDRFAGKEPEEQTYEPVIDERYEKTMSSLAHKLCNRSYKLLKNVNKKDDEEYNQTMNSVLNLTGKAEIAINNNLYYSAASYCFGANVKLTYLLLYLDNITIEDVKEKLQTIGRNIEKLEKSIDKRKKETVTDLEAYSVVKERLIESKDYKERLLKRNISTENITKDDIYNLAYSFERVYSAFSWANFFDHRGKRYDFNKELLESSCHDKIAEAEERYQYVSLFYPLLDLSGTRKEIDYAYDDLRNENYELCLFKATKAKAESDIILSVSGIGNDKIKSLLDKKIEIAKRNIAKQLDKGNFPILAYSYYEYANELKEDDTYSSLLYAEYALELSNLDMYFKQRRKPFIVRINTEPVLFISIGILFGAGITYLFFRPIKQKKRKKYKPEQSREALLGKKR